MKPFDLQAALAGKPVVTRDGRKVVELLQRLAFVPWQGVDERGRMTDRIRLSTGGLQEDVYGC